MAISSEDVVFAAGGLVLGAGLIHVINNALTPPTYLSYGAAGSAQPHNSAGTSSSKKKSSGSKKKKKKSSPKKKSSSKKSSSPAKHTISSRFSGAHTVAKRTSSGGHSGSSSSKHQTNSSSSSKKPSSSQSKPSASKQSTPSKQGQGTPSKGGGTPGNRPPITPTSKSRAKQISKQAKKSSTFKQNVKSDKASNKANKPAFKREVQQQSQQKKLQKQLSKPKVQALNKSFSDRFKATQQGAQKAPTTPGKRAASPSQLSGITPQKSQSPASLPGRATGAQPAQFGAPTPTQPTTSKGRALNKPATPPHQLSSAQFNKLKNVAPGPVIGGQVGVNAIHQSQANQLKTLRTAGGVGIGAQRGVDLARSQLRASNVPTKSQSPNISFPDSNLGPGFSTHPLPSKVTNKGRLLNSNPLHEDLSGITPQKSQSPASLPGRATGAQPAQFSGLTPTQPSKQRSQTPNISFPDSNLGPGFSTVPLTRKSSTAKPGLVAAPKTSSMRVNPDGSGTMMMANGMVMKHSAAEVASINAQRKAAGLSALPGSPSTAPKTQFQVRGGLNALTNPFGGQGFPTGNLNIKPRPGDTPGVKVLNSGDLQAVKGSRNIRDPGLASAQLSGPGGLMGGLTPFQQKNPAPTAARPANLTKPSTAGQLINAEKARNLGVNATRPTFTPAGNITTGATAPPAGGPQAIAPASLGSPTDLGSALKGFFNKTSTHNVGGCGSNCPRIQTGVTGPEANLNATSSDTRVRMTIPSNFKGADSVSGQVAGGAHCEGCDPTGYKPEFGINGGETRIQKETSGALDGGAIDDKVYTDFPGNKGKVSDFNAKPGHTYDFRVTKDNVKVNGKDAAHVQGFAQEVVNGKPVGSPQKVLDGVDSGNVKGDPVLTRAGKPENAVEQFRTDRFESDPNSAVHGFSAKTNTGGPQSFGGARTSQRDLTARGGGVNVIRAQNQARATPGGSMRFPDDIAGTGFGGTPRGFNNRETQIRIGRLVNSNNTNTQGAQPRTISSRFGSRIAAGRQLNSNKRTPAAQFMSSGHGVGFPSGNVSGSGKRPSGGVSGVPGGNFDFRPGTTEGNVRAGEMSKLGDLARSHALGSGGSDRMNTPEAGAFKPVTPNGRVLNATSSTTKVDPRITGKIRPGEHPNTFKVIQSSKLREITKVSGPRAADINSMRALFDAKSNDPNAQRAIASSLLKQGRNPKNIADALSVSNSGTSAPLRRTFTPKDFTTAAGNSPGAQIAQDAAIKADTEIQKAKIASLNADKTAGVLSSRFKNANTFSEQLKNRAMTVTGAKLSLERGKTVAQLKAEGRNPGAVDQAARELSAGLTTDVESQMAANKKRSQFNLGINVGNQTSARGRQFNKPLGIGNVPATNRPPAKSGNILGDIANNIQNNLKNLFGSGGGAGISPKGGLLVPAAFGKSNTHFDAQKFHEFAQQHHLSPAQEKKFADQLRQQDAQQPSKPWILNGRPTLSPHPFNPNAPPGHEHDLVPSYLPSQRTLHFTPKGYKPQGAQHKVPFEDKSIEPDFAQSVKPRPGGTGKVTQAPEIDQAQNPHDDFYGPGIIRVAHQTNTGNTVGPWQGTGGSAIGDTRTIGKNYRSGNKVAKGSHPLEFPSKVTRGGHGEQGQYGLSHGNKGDDPLHPGPNRQNPNREEDRLGYPQGGGEDFHVDTTGGIAPSSGGPHERNVAPEASDQWNYATYARSYFAITLA